MLPQVLTSILVDAASIAVPVGLLALSACTVIVLVGWRRRSELLERQSRPLFADRIELGRGPLVTGLLDIASAATAVLRQFESVAAQRLVALEVAVQPGLAVHADPRALQEILGDLVRDAIEQSLCGRVLLGAAHVDGRVRISVSDDGVHVDRALRAGRLRPAERLAALQGATMDIDARAGQGTTVVLWLPASALNRTAEANEGTSDPAGVWGSAEREREGSNAGR